MSAQEPVSAHPRTSAADAEPYRTPMEVAWQFDYAIEIEKLRELYSKAKRTQWDAESRLDWSVEVDPSKPIVGEDRFVFLKIPFIQRLSAAQRETFVAHATAQLLSQFLHGEQGALMTAATLTHAVPDYEAKLYGATQTMDEARHVEVYERYIRKLALVYPISPWLKELIDVTLRADHYVKILIGMRGSRSRRSTTCAARRAVRCCGTFRTTACRMSRATWPSGTSTCARRSRRCTPTIAKTSPSSPTRR